MQAKQRKDTILNKALQGRASARLVLSLLEPLNPMDIDMDCSTVLRDKKAFYSAGKRKVSHKIDAGPLHKSACIDEVVKPGAVLGQHISVLHQPEEYVDILSS